MVDQEFSLSESNAEWLAAQEDKNAVINTLLDQERRRADHTAWVQAQLDAAEKSGYVTMTRDDITKEIKAQRKSDV